MDDSQSACTDPRDEELETFLKEIEIDDEGDRKAAAADSWRVSAGGEGKESNKESLFKGNIKDEKMDTKDEKGILRRDQAKDNKTQATVMTIAIASPPVSLPDRPKVEMTLTAR